MRRTLYCFLLILACGLTQAQDYQLAKPLVQVEGGSFFEKSTTVSCEFRLEGANIHYTLDGTEPNTSSKKYSKPIRIKKSAMLKVRAFKEGFQPSETITYQLFKLKGSPVSVKLSPAPKAPYNAEAGKTLHDKKSGSFNFRDGNWVGYNKGPITVDIDLGKAMSRKEIVLSSLTSPGSWIMHPDKVEARYSKDGKDFTSQFWTSKIQRVKEGDAAEKRYYRFTMDGNYRYVRITVHPMAKLPGWHPGKGQPGWVFIDEILIQE